MLILFWTKSRPMCKIVRQSPLARPKPFLCNILWPSFSEERVRFVLAFHPAKLVFLR